MIYNIFPRLAGPFDRWTPHLERAKSMGFGWIFINSFHYPGFSGSLYSVKDYYKLNPIFFNHASAEPPMEQLRGLLKTMKKMGLHPMMDLIINHTAIDCVLVSEHPNWYKHNPDGTIKNPGAWEGDKLVTLWGDLATIDNEHSPDRDSLWNYWLKLCLFYLELGFEGFRCDAAYQVPDGLWRFLITKTKEKYPKARFFAESLGCELKDVIRLMEAGFDYSFNSSKWWNFEAPWCLKQYNALSPYGSSVSFTETHDTERLAAELNGNVAAISARYLFSALFSTGIMMPIGFEFGFRKRMNVVETRPNHWEEASFDLTDFIGRANSLKMKYKIFQEDNFMELLPPENPNIACIKKTSRDKKEEALFIINKSLGHPAQLNLADITKFFGSGKIPKDISLDRPLALTQPSLKAELLPAEMKVLYSPKS
ncbi:MAG: alpha-amylase family glycosyl hydrolase [Candidatus Omnitrophica bacterium]|nr:alpha-amylase family glycosyl hydrolase [Candidatus Omnitrophota bacterium]